MNLIVYGPFCHGALKLDTVCFACKSFSFCSHLYNLYYSIFKQLFSKTKSESEVSNDDVTSYDGACCGLDELAVHELGPAQHMQYFI